MHKKRVVRMYEAWGGNPFRAEFLARCAQQFETVTGLRPTQVWFSDIAVADHYHSGGAQIAVAGLVVRISDGLLCHQVALSCVQEIGNGAPGSAARRLEGHS